MLHQPSRRAALAAAAAVTVLGLASWGNAQVVINEVVYDDGGTDEREFVELYNSGPNSVDISGWILGGRDPSGNNGSVTINAGTTLAPGAFYVIGYANVANVNQTVTGATGFWENDNESIELLNGATLVDAVVYEANKGLAFAPADVLAQVGPGFFGNVQVSDLAGGPPNQTTGSLGRWVNGRDTNNNGRDFGFRVATPGASNNPTNITVYATPDVSGSTVGANVPGFAYSFVSPRVIDPTVADANNPNVIPAAPGTGKAIIAWDPSGGGNGSASAETFDTTEARFDVKAYFDTRDLPLMSNAAGTTFRGSEFTSYGIGSADALMNATNISGQTNFAGLRDNGLTGVHWLYEKVGETATGLGDVSEKLYLVDANDGGDQAAGDWAILATVDLSGVQSGWYDLGIAIDAAGMGVAHFNGQVFNFTTSTAMNGSSFAIGYRENTQIGSDGTPDAILRPPTFTVIPEPASLGLLAMGAGLLAARRRK